MNMLVLHPSAVPFSRPGMHRVESLFNPLLLDGKIKRIDVVTSSYLHHGGYSLDITEEQGDRGIQYNYVRTREYDNTFVRMFSMIDYYLNGFKHVKNNIKRGKSYDWIYASSPHLFSFILGMRLSMKYEIPLIVEVRDYWPEVFFTAGLIRENSIFGYILRKVEKIIYSHADYIVLLKPGDYKYFEEKRMYKKDYKEFVKKSYYLNNGVNFENNRNYTGKKIKKRGFINIIYAGSLRKTNEIKTVLEAMKLLSHDYPEVILHICGEGPDKKIVQEYEKYGNVVYQGFIDQKELNDIYEKMDFALFHYSQDRYNWERGVSSNKIFEYLAAGLPILQTFQVGTTLHEDYDKSVIQSQDNSPSSISEMIIKAVEIDDDKYCSMSKNAVEVAKSFDYKKLGNDFYQTILKNNGGKKC